MILIPATSWSSHRHLRRGGLELPARHDGQPLPGHRPGDPRPDHRGHHRDRHRRAGGTVHYTLTITDTGQTPYTGITVTDDLTGLLDDAAYGGDAAATAGSVSFTSPDLTWAGT